MSLTQTLMIATAVSLSVAILALYAAWRSRAKVKSMQAELGDVSTALSDLQSRDSVTGVLTPLKFEQELRAACKRSDRSGRSLCVLYIDLDHFHATNEAFGREAGDAVLKEVARRIASTLRTPSPVMRLAGNEFGMLVERPLVEAQSVAARLMEHIALPLPTAGTELRLTCSIGIASYPHQGTQRHIVERAAVAMRRVKLQGGDGFSLYDQQEAEGLRDSAKLLHDLRRSVERQELELFYQPKIDAKTLQITAVEALVRWRHPELGMISPDRFITLAERYGYIEILGTWVIEEACRQAQFWRSQGLRMRIAVNISGPQMQQDDFVDKLARTLAATDTPPSRFTCEITESVAMEDTAATMRTFDRLRELGVHVSIDDFGTGHSSLASLKRLPAQELKIDRAFVTDLDTNEHAQFIATTIVNMAHALGLKVVAEGVETQQQRDHLVAMGCDELQGYLFSKPMRALELGVWAALDHSDEQRDQQFRPSLYSDTIAGQLQ